ncbi:TVP38/TMEM64 family protein [Anditalea andensis]|uniref:TVP38/TMEM64 family membrane protein n=1 Tax=Anditalea andensis TaxID=1048983 RepID=A0A074KVX2_9BACT|nr:TVP38/TMEM64 family protein [Anditalea andensis]KEO71763.1 hypothetical protein EL17_21495 [Anditalea andensis]
MNTKEAKGESKNKKSKLPLYVSLALIGIAIATYFLIPEVQQFFQNAWEVLTSGDENRTKEWVSQFGWIGPVILIVSMVAQIVVLVIPSFALMVVSILAYGPIWGSLIVLAAIYSAATVAYFIGRIYGASLVKRFIGEKSEKKAVGFLEDYGFWAVIITRINPLLSNDAISLIAGILKMNYWKFVGATLVGIAPLTVFIAVLGETTDGLKTGFIWVSVVSLFLFIAYIWWDKKRKS